MTTKKKKTVTSVARAAQKARSSLARAAQKARSTSTKSRASNSRAAKARASGVPHVLNLEHSQRLLRAMEQ
ncbi:MAG TPA: hypothetical protein VFX59_10365, partial [Polyangiales bacterium]|nr:hypothetical protein [Polyangiales bacterium]